MKFLSNVLATLVGLFVFCFLSFFFFVIIAAVAGGGDGTVTVKDQTVIELDLSEITNDYAGKYTDPWVESFLGESRVGVTDVLNAIEAAKKDDQIEGISILNATSGVGIAQAKAIRDALADFKKAKKFVVCYGNMFTQKEYYIGSVADTVYMNPVGEMDFRGLSAELLFFKDLQEKYGVKMEVIRHGKYKSAVEPFLENKMSEANREQLTSLLTGVWGALLDDISKSRKVPVGQLNAIADDMLARTPEMAKSQKLIDRIAYEDDYHNGIRHALKVKKDKDYNTVAIADYAKKVGTTIKEGSGSDRIAIIYAQGEIGSGEGDVNYIGEGSMRRALKEARDNKRIKAVVLRIDSPGGSALTSELIWREVELTKKVKPVIVSMGNYAASGGYYIACGANTLFAEESTLTGSIGVFGMLPNVKGLTDRIGINAETVGTNKNAAPYSPFRPLDEKNRAVLTESVEHIYTTFVNRVAKGRKMTAEQVDALAQGRVWSGRDAVKIGLVDKIGGLDAALAEAARQAKIKEYRTMNFPEYKKELGDVLAGLMPFAKSKENLLKKELGEENYRLLQQIREASQIKGIQARLPYAVELK